MRVLMVDNFDSFTYNLVHYLEGEGAELTVVRNNNITQADVANYSHVIISPGPALPEQSGRLLELFSWLRKDQHVLGVCLGMQAMVIAAGGKLEQLTSVRHGVKEDVLVDRAFLEVGIFKNLPAVFSVGLYHSWKVELGEATSAYYITARSRSGVPMAIAHKSINYYGVQFHPESILSEHGRGILRNWMGA